MNPSIRSSFGMSGFRSWVLTGYTVARNPRRYYAREGALPKGPAVPELIRAERHALHFAAIYFKKFRSEKVNSTVPRIMITERALITGDTPKRIAE